MRITVELESDATKDERGYDRRETMAKLEVDVDAPVAWEVYQYIVERVTAPTFSIERDVS